MKKLFIVAAILLSPTFAFASFDQNLKYGSHGTAVSELQDFLVTQGCLTITPSGNFFSMTLRAVKCFQGKNNLPTSGYFGPMSRAVASTLLAQDLASSSAQEIVETGATTLPVGTLTAHANIASSISTTLGCRSTTGFSPLTGQPCSSTAISAPNTPSQTQTALCNGIYYSPCTTGSTLVCPSNGGAAYCQTPYQAPTSSPSPSPTPTPSPAPTPVLAPVTPPPTSQARLDVKFNMTSAEQFVDEFHAQVDTYDNNGVYAKLPVTVTTNDPDWSPSFIINAAGMTGNAGAGSLDKVVQTSGTFTFTFTQPDLNLSKTLQLQVLPYTGTLNVVRDPSSPSGNRLENTAPLVAAFKFIAQNDSFNVTEMTFKVKSENLNDANVINYLMFNGSGIPNQSLAGIYATTTSGINLALGSNIVLNVYASSGTLTNTTSANIGLTLVSFKAKSSAPNDCSGMTIPLDTDPSYSTSVKSFQDCMAGIKTYNVNASSNDIYIVKSLQ